MNSKSIKRVFRNDVRPGELGLTGNEQVRREIQGFLEALKSYPERFSKDPSISFAEHCRAITPSGKTSTKTGSRRRA